MLIKPGQIMTDAHAEAEAAQAVQLFFVRGIVFDQKDDIQRSVHSFFRVLGRRLAACLTPLADPAPQWERGQASSARDACFQFKHKCVYL
ncbi:hypothetical protein L499_A2221 [Bordetella holmesii CDC-H635-BH]|nr:hypothetical protein L499_A2221 [Bordetella holmesii CDC-H635-BH]